MHVKAKMSFPYDPFSTAKKKYLLPRFSGRPYLRYRQTCNNRSLISFRCLHSDR